MEKVSIVVPTYNRGTLLQDTLNSILQQTYLNIEIIITDDGSTDNTVDIIEQAMKSDNRITLIKCVHQGAPGGCRNKGLAMASGELIIFFDSDDIMHADMIEKMVKQFDETSDLVICNANFYDVSKNIMIDSGMDKMLTEKVATNDCFIEYPPFPCNKLYRKRFLIEHDMQFLEGVFSQDLSFYITLLMYSPQIKRISEKLMDYIIHSNSITKSKKLKNHIHDILTVFDEIYNKINSNIVSDVFKEKMDILLIKVLTANVNKLDIKTNFDDLLVFVEYLNNKIPHFEKTQAFRKSFSTMKRNYVLLIFKYRIFFLISFYQKKSI